MVTDKWNGPSFPVSNVAGITKNTLPSGRASNRRSIVFVTVEYRERSRHRQTLHAVCMQ